MLLLRGGNGVWGSGEDGFGQIVPKGIKSGIMKRDFIIVSNFSTMLGFSNCFCTSKRLVDDVHPLAEVPAQRREAERSARSENKVVLRDLDGMSRGLWVLLAACCGPCIPAMPIHPFTIEAAGSARTIS